MNNKIFISHILKLFVILCLSFSCSTISSSSKNEQCLKVRVESQFPLILKDKSLFDNRDSFDIYYLKNFKIIKFYVTTDNYQNGSYTSTEVHNNFFITTETSQSGFWIDHKNVIKTYPVDSILTNFAFYNQDWYGEVHDSLLEVKINNYTNPGLIRKFVIKNKSNADPDTIIYTLTNKWKKLDFDFSISNYLEKETGLKVGRFAMIFDSKYNEEYGFKLPKSEMHIEIKSIDTINCDELQFYINMVKPLM